MAELSDAPDCFLERTYMDTSGFLRHEVMHLNEVQSIEDTISADLSEFPIVTYPADQRFVTDLGTTRKFVVNIVRSNPFPYDDGSSDDRDWSNGYWYKKFREFFDIWQNFNLTYDGSKMAGGYLFSYRVPKDTYDLYPDISDVRVFLSGSLQPDFQVGKMTLSIPLQVSNMDVEGGSGEKIKITLSSSHPGVSDVIMEQYKNVAFTAPNAPSEWVDSIPDEVFDSWALSAGGEGQILPGKPVRFSEDTTLYSKWNPIIGRAWFNYYKYVYTPDTGGVITPIGPDDKPIPGTYSVDLPDNCTNIRAYIIGAGGGAGSPYIDPNSTIDIYGWLGGGGGSGELKIISFDVIPSNSLHIGLGTGGNAGIGHRSGDPGEKTILSRTELGETTLSVSANGGFGGSKGSPSGGLGGSEGGLHGGAGGTGGKGKLNEKITAGEPGVSGVYSIGDSSMRGVPGYGSEAWSDTSYPVTKMAGGGGGGSTGFRYNFRKKDGSIDQFWSVGGNSYNLKPGASKAEVDAAITNSNGQYGGGGGAVRLTSNKGGRGGHGLVILEFS